MLVTVDTNIMIWGLRRESTTGQEAMIARSAAFINWLDQHGHKLAFTSQVVSEYFVGDIPDDQRAIESKILTARFKVLPFDASAALIAAKIRSDKSFLNSLGTDLGKTRACVKADVIIVATAIANKVDRIYTNDNDIKSIANREGLHCMALPSIASYLPTLSPSPARPDRIRNLFATDDA